MKQLSLLVITALLSAQLAAQEFTIGVMPDTQNMAETPEGLQPIKDMVSYFTSNQATQNIKFVSSLGDMTQWGAWDQWERVREAYDGFNDAGLPYAPCQGNHDPDLNVMANFFPVSEWQNRSYFAGYSGGMHNAYYLFEWSGMEFLILVIQSHDQFIGGYDLPSIEWANGILDQYPTKRALVVTHDWFERDWLQNDLINKHDNVFMTLCGHSCAREDYFTRTSPSGNIIHYFMTDYQCDWDKGATIRTYTFKPDENMICARTYNTTTQTYETDYNSEFCVDYEMTIATVPVISAVSNDPLYPSSSQTANVTAKIRDDISIASATLDWGLAEGQLGNQLTMTAAGDDVYATTIPTNEDGSTVFYTITGVDGDGNSTTSEVFQYVIDDDGSSLPCPYNTAQTPYNGVISIPGLLEAENYNEGCDNVAYYDTDQANQGGAHRQDQVDIEACQDVNGGFNIGYTKPGEWLNYSVDVAATGSYTLDMRLASASNGTPAFHIEIAGENITGEISVTPTGGWQTWETITLNDIMLTAGAQTLKVVIDGGDLNLNNIAFTLTSNVTQPVITNVSHDPVHPRSSDAIAIGANIIDDVSVSSAQVIWGTVSGSLGNQVALIHDGATYSGSIPAQLDLTTVYYAIVATDGDGNETISSERSVTVTDAIVFHSYELVMQDIGSKATVTASGVVAEVQFYQSIVGAPTKGDDFTTYTGGSHAQDFNHVSNMWSSATYPYVGKSTVARGEDTGESGALSPLGVFDMQMHPPPGDQMTVATFVAPEDGDYTITHLGVRRVYENTADVALKVYDDSESLVTELVANSRAWTTNNDQQVLGFMNAGDVIYFAVDKVEDYSYDAAEVSWEISMSNGIATNVTTEFVVKDPEYRLFPNPNTIDYAYLEFPSCDYAFDVNIKDVTGKVVYHRADLEGEVGIELDGFARGTYVFEVVTPRKVISEKLVIQ